MSLIKHCRPVLGQILQTSYSLPNEHDIYMNRESNTYLTKEQKVAASTYSNLYRDLCVRKVVCVKRHSM